MTAFAKDKNIHELSEYFKYINCGFGSIEYNTRCVRCELQRKITITKFLWQIDVILEFKERPRFIYYRYNFEIMLEYLDIAWGIYIMLFFVIIALHLHYSYEFMSHIAKNYPKIWNRFGLKGIQPTPFQLSNVNRIKIVFKEIELRKNDESMSDELKTDKVFNRLLKRSQIVMVVFMVYLLFLFLFAMMSS